MKKREEARGAKKDATKAEVVASAGAHDKDGGVGGSRDGGGHDKGGGGTGGGSAGGGGGRDGGEGSGFDDDKDRNDKGKDSGGKKEGDVERGKEGEKEGEVGVVEGQPKFSNVEVRKWYLEQESRIPSLLDKNKSLEEQAKQAFNLRNQFRSQAREMMEDRELAESLSQTDPNYSWEDIVQKQIDKGFIGEGIYTQIISSAQRSRKDVNKSLGLE